MIKNMLKNKRLVIILLSVLLVLLVTTGATFSYLTSVTGEKENVFTPSDNIRARLTEPNWDAEEALKLVPGKTVGKDPMITNTGKSDEYVAIRLTFQYEEDGESLSEADLIKLMNLIKISWNSKWVLCDDAMTIDGTGKVTAITQPLIFYYNESLAPGKISDPIFSSIGVKNKMDGLTEAGLRWLQAIKIVDGVIVDDADGLGVFHIKIEGAAVQTVSFANASDAANSLKTLFP